MKMKVLTAATLMVLATLLCTGSAFAVIDRLKFDAWTTNYPNVADQQVNFWITVRDSVYKHMPNYVDTIVITAPDGTVLNLDPVLDYLPYDRGYWGRLFVGDFIGGVFPTGDYTCVVTAGNVTLTASDYVRNSFLRPPLLIEPLDQAVDVELTPLIKWGNVPNATHFRVLLWNEDGNEPVYWFWDQQMRKDIRNFRVPAGMLKPYTNYRLRIEARDSNPDLDRRSRCAWINFTTGPYVP